MIKGKNILITGGTGFIGSHLAEMLVTQGNNVTCFDRYNINDHKLIYKGELKGDLANGYFNGYGELSRSDGSILKGTFKNGQFKKGKRMV